MSKQTIDSYVFCRQDCSIWNEVKLCFPVLNISDDILKSLMYYFSLFQINFILLDTEELCSI